MTEKIILTGSELDGTRSAKADVISEVFSRLSISENDKRNALMIGDRKHDRISIIPLQFLE